MATIRAERMIHAPIDEVFDGLTDHAEYDRFRIVRRAELVRPGDAEANGVGAVRKITIGPLRFVEEITSFERPTAMTYLIREINAPFEHEGGRIELESVGDGTRVVWTSTFTIPIAGVGGIAAKLIAPLSGPAFASALRDAAALVER